MNDLDGRVAVITGAGGDLGRALAERAAAEGMYVVLADADVGALEETERILKGEGATALAVLTDPTDPEAVARLARETLDEYGAAQLLCLCPPSTGAPTVWESDSGAWRAALENTVLGTISAIRAFLPILLGQDEGHVVTCASIAGLLPFSPSAADQAAQAALIALTENLAVWLRTAGAPVGVSLVLADPTGPPETVAAKTFAGLREGRLYLVAQPDDKQALRQRFEAILAGLPDR